MDLHLETFQREPTVDPLPQKGSSWWGKTWQWLRDKTPVALGALAMQQIFESASVHAGLQAQGGRLNSVVAHPFLNVPASFCFHALSVAHGIIRELGYGPTVSQLKCDPASHWILVSQIPLVEEALFRGILQPHILKPLGEKCLQPLNFLTEEQKKRAASIGAIVIGAAIFASTHHVNEYTSGTAPDEQLGSLWAQRFVRGIYYGGVAEVGGSVLPSILTHMLHNEGAFQGQCSLMS